MIDGWRLDIPWKVPIDFWREFRQRVKRVNPDAYIVGEIWRDPSPWLRGDTCDGVMNYPLRDYILDYVVFETMDAEDFDYEITRQLKSQSELAPFQLNLLGSHDTPRFLTLCKNDAKRANVAWTFVFTHIGAPMIYYGDEVGLEGEDDPDCRRTMPWDKSWNEDILDNFKRLIKIRSQHVALRIGDYKTLLVFNGVYAFKRQYEKDEIIVILNPREARKDIRIPLHQDPSRTRKWSNLISGKHYFEQKGTLAIDELPSMAAFVLKPE
jgi:glycosidase